MCVIFLFALQFCFQRGNRILSKARKVPTLFDLFIPSLLGYCHAQNGLNYSIIKSHHVIDSLPIRAAKFCLYVFLTSHLCTGWSGKISFLIKIWGSLPILMGELYAIQIWKPFMIIWHGGKWTVSFLNYSRHFSSTNNHILMLCNYVCWCSLQ